MGLRTKSNGRECIFDRNVYRELWVWIMVKCQAIRSDAMGDAMNFKSSNNHERSLKRYEAKLRMIFRQMGCIMWLKEFLNVDWTYLHGKPNVRMQMNCTHFTSDRIRTDSAELLQSPFFPILTRRISGCTQSKALLRSMNTPVTFSFSFKLHWSIFTISLTVVCELHFRRNPYWYSYL